MGKMNLLKASWEGKVGETVGAKWKDKSVIRTYSKPTDPKTSSQVEVRDGFSYMTKFFALFADQIRYLNALDTKSMSVKNALIKMNKAVIKDNPQVPENYGVSKGGLQTPNVSAGAYATATGVVSATVDAPSATNFSTDAKLIAIAVAPEAKIAVVSEQSYDAGSVNVTLPSGITENIYLYVYFLDKRGSSKVASISAGVKVQ